MAIQLDVTRLSSSAANLAGADVQTAESAPSKLSPLLGGASLSVSSGTMSDLEALVAKLKNENEKTKYSLLLTSLNSISESLTAAQKAALEEGLKLNEELNGYQRELAVLTGNLDSATADSIILQAKIDSLQKQIEQAQADGQEHNELVAKQKELREELDAKKAVIADTQGKIAEVKNNISVVNGKISAIVKSIGDNTLKTIANEIAAIAEPEDNESNAESEKNEKKAEANDPFNLIRESLDRICRELTDTIEKNTETMV